MSFNIEKHNQTNFTSLATLFKVNWNCWAKQCIKHAYRQYWKNNACNSFYMSSVLLAQLYLWPRKFSMSMKNIGDPIF